LGVPSVNFTLDFSKKFVYIRLRHLAAVGISVRELLMRPEPDAGCRAIEGGGGGGGVGGEGEGKEGGEEEGGEEEEEEEEEEGEGEEEAGGEGEGGGGGDDNNAAAAADDDDLSDTCTSIYISLLTRS
jgi:hypothetical protein